MSLEPHLQQDVDLSSLKEKLVGDDAPPADPESTGEAEGGEGGETPPTPEPRTTPTEMDPRYLQLLQEQRVSSAAKIEAQQERERREQAQREREELENEARTNPAAFAKRMGLTLDEFTEFELNGDDGKAQHRATETRIAKLEQRLEERERQLQELEQQKAQEAQMKQIDEYKQGLRQTVSSSPVGQLIDVADLHDAVYSVIESDAARQMQLYGQVHQLMEPTEAAKHVARDHTPRLKKMLEGLRELPEFKDLFVASNPAANVSPPNKGPTSIMRSQVSTENPPEKPKENETKEETIARLVAKMKSGGFNT